MLIVWWFDGKSWAEAEPGRGLELDKGGGCTLCWEETLAAAMLDGPRTSGWRGLPDHRCHRIVVEVPARALPAVHSAGRMDVDTGNHQKNKERKC